MKSSQNFFRLLANHLTRPFSPSPLPLFSLSTVSSYIFFLIFTFFLPSFPASSQGIINLNTSHYGGSPQNWAVIQDSSGIIYIANTDGILINKGASWQLVPVGENLSALSLALDQKGRVYCGGYGDFGYLYCTKEGLVKYQSLLPLLSDSLKDFRNVWQTFALQDGNICFNALKYLFIYKTNQERMDALQTSGRKNDIQVLLPTQKSFFKTFYANNILWLLQKGGEGFYQLEKKDSKYSISKPFPGTEIFAEKSAFTLLSIDTNRFLGGIMGGGLFHWDYNRKTVELIPENYPPALANAQIYCGNIMNQYEFIIGTLQDGIFIFNQWGGLLRHITRNKNGLLGDRVNNLFSASNENLWVSLENGISIVPFTEPLRYFPEGKGFSGGIQCIMRYPGDEAPYKIQPFRCFNQSEDSGKQAKVPLVLSHIYIGTSLGVWKSKTLMPEPGEWERIENIKTQCYNFLISHSGDLLVAGGDGIYLIGTKQSTVAKKLETAPGARCFAPFSLPCAHKHKGILACGQNGVSLLLEEEKSHASLIFSQPNLILHKSEFPDEILTIVPIEEASDNNTKEFWLGARSQGIWKLTVTGCPFSAIGNSDTFHINFHPVDTTSGMDKGQVQIFLNNNVPLFCHENLGVFRFNNSQNKFEHDTLTQFLSGNKHKDNLLIDRIVYPSENTLWMSSGKRLYYGFKNKSAWVSDTLPFLGLDIGNIRAIFPDTYKNFMNRYVWIGGDEGLVLFDQTEKKNYHASYPCFLERIVSGRDCVLFSGIFAKPIQDGHDPTHYLPALNQDPSMVQVLEFEMGNLRFEYSAFFKEHETQLRYTARLEGFEENWREWSERKFAEYTNLREGDYIFHVKSRNVYRQESNEIRFHFILVPPFHRTWWFYSLQLGGIVFLFLLAGYLRRRSSDSSSPLALAIGTVGIFTVFEYFQNMVESAAENFLGTIILFKVALNVIMAFALIPLERLMNRILKLEKKVGLSPKDKKEMTGLEEDERERVRKEAQEKIIEKMKKSGMKDEEIEEVMRSN